MDRADLFGALRETGMPVAYRDWGEAEPPALPYVVFFSTGSDYFRADDRNYAEAREWCVEDSTARPSTTPARRPWRPFSRACPSRSTRTR